MPPQFVCSEIAGSIRRDASRVFGIHRGRRAAPVYKILCIGDRIQLVVRYRRNLFPALCSTGDFRRLGMFI